ncbi:MAG: OadG family protein [Spirochaetia bacterium]|jgi:Na+-transporting methylmalonyl-CoA/oxaloacetate decarboxylase gamma subunit|nr:OadG family protein [Spirochaetia bacterium]
MNIESYSYTVLASIVGMGIVFAFLAFLSLLMVVINRIFDGKDQGVAVKTSSAKNNAAAGAKANGVSTGNGKEAEDNTWIIAAVAAFLEEEDMPVSAVAWQPAGDEKLDPWVSAPGGHRQAVRVF